MNPSFAHCIFCAEDAATGITKQDFIKPTFTDHDKLLPGEWVCSACAVWFDESSTELAAIMGKSKPQRMRNYSHFIKAGEWTPLSKAQKKEMQDQLLNPPFPELAAIANSGQKHIVFRALHNPMGARCGWVQLEEQRVFVDPLRLRMLLSTVEPMLATFSKTQIAGGRYYGECIRKFGLQRWRDSESQIVPHRGSLLFELAIFLSQKEKEESRGTKIGRVAGDPMAINPGGLQDSLSDHDLDAIRE